MMGFSKSPSLKPTARNIARLGERATPAVISWERLLSFVTSISFLACRRAPSRCRRPKLVQLLGTAADLLDLAGDELPRVLQMRLPRGQLGGSKATLRHCEPAVHSVTVC